MEVRFKTDATAIPPGNVGDDFYFHMDNDSTGNVPWTVRWGKRNGASGLGLRVFTNQNQSGGGFDLNTYDNNYHVIRVVQTPQGTTGAFTSFYFDGVQVGFTISDASSVYSFARNRTNGFGGIATSGLHIDYIRISDQAVPIELPLGFAPEPSTGLLALVGGAMALCGRSRQV